MIQYDLNGMLIRCIPVHMFVYSTEEEELYNVKLYKQKAKKKYNILTSLAETYVTQHSHVRHYLPCGMKRLL